MVSKKQKIPEHVLAMAAQAVLQLEDLAVRYTLNGATENLELLLKNGLSVNTRCWNMPESPTLLHIAAAAGHTQVVLLLLRLGADRSFVIGAGGTPLHQAAGLGRVSTVKAMLEAGCPVDVVASNGASALNFAIAGGSAEILREVLTTGCDINTTDNDGITPLHVAAGMGKTEAVLELIRRGANKAIVAGKEGTPLHQAAGCSHVSTVKAMLKAGCPVDVVSSDGDSVLHAAAIGGNAEVIKDVLSTGCDINATDNDGKTPLHVAAREGKTEAALELIKHGANRAMVAGTNGTPLHQAALRGHVSTVAAMLRAGCPVDAVMNNGVSILHAAAQGGNVEVIREVMSTGCDINATDNDGETPLHLAAGEGKTDAALELIRHGANRAIVADTRGTPLHQAAAFGHASTVNEMLKKGCPVDVMANDGVSVLHAAAHGGNAEMIKDVFNSGCDINAADNNGRTPLHVAAMKGNAKALMELIRCGVTEDSEMNADAPDVHGFTPLDCVHTLNNTDVHCWTPLHCAVHSHSKDCVRILLEHGADPRKAAPYFGSSYIMATMSGPTAVIEAFDTFIVEEEVGRLPWTHEVLSDPLWSSYIHQYQLDRCSALDKDAFGMSNLEYMLIFLATVNEELVVQFHNFPLVNSENLLLLAAILGLSTFVNSFIGVATFDPSFAAQTVTSLVKVHFSGFGAMQHIQELVPPDASLNLLHVAVLALKGSTSGKAFITDIRSDHTSLLKLLVTSDPFCHTLHKCLPSGLTPLDLAEMLGLKEAVNIISSAGGRHGIYSMISEEVRSQHGPILLLLDQQLMKLASSGAYGQQAVQALFSKLLPGRTTVEQGTDTEESYIRQQKALDQRPDLSVISTNFIDHVNAEKWRRLGISLKISQEALIHISSTYSSCEDRYLEVLMYWLAHNEVASWRTLLEVLDHFETKQTMDKLAQKVLESYGSQVSGMFATKVVNCLSTMWMSYVACIILYHSYSLFLSLLPLTDSTHLHNLSQCGICCCSFPTSLNPLFHRSYFPSYHTSAVPSVYL